MTGLSQDIFCGSDAIGALVDVRVVILRKAGTRGFDGVMSDPDREVHTVRGVIGPRVEMRKPGEDGTRVAGDRTYYLERSDTFTLDPVDVAKNRVWLENRYLAQTVSDWPGVYEGGCRVA